MGLILYKDNRHFSDVNTVLICKCLFFYFNCSYCLVTLQAATFNSFQNWRSQQPKKTSRLINFRQRLFTSLQISAGIEPQFFIRLLIYNTFPKNVNSIYLRAKSKFFFQPLQLSNFSWSSFKNRFNPSVDHLTLRKFLNFYILTMTDAILYANDGYIVEDDLKTCTIYDKQ